MSLTNKLVSYKTFNELGVGTDGTNEHSCLDDLNKNIRPPCHNMDKGKQIINKKF